MSRTLADLRAYAKSRGIKNVKAIKGGKPALVDRLLSLNNKEQMMAKSKKVEKEVKAAGGKSWDKLDAMSKSELSGIDLGTLRKYARHHLNIIGASKLKGGKPTLLDKIVEVRGGK